MKKIVSILLVVILAFSCLAVIGAAAEENDGSFAEICSVMAAPESSEKIRVVGVDGSNYVKKGESFSFKIEILDDYVIDQTTVFKVANTHYAADLVLKGEKEYGYVIEPDANGVYTIENVEKDLYIYACNLEAESFASLKDFLFNMMNFFLNLMKWFFGV